MANQLPAAAACQTNHVVPRVGERRAVGLALVWAGAISVSCAGSVFAYQVGPLTVEQAEQYQLAPSFYKKCTVVQDILIASSQHVSDFAQREAAYQFDMIMRSIDPRVAQRVRDPQTERIAAHAQSMREEAIRKRAESGTTPAAVGSVDLSTLADR